MIIVYTHLQPDVSAEVLPFKYKPPIIALGHILLALIKLYISTI